MEPRIVSSHIAKIIREHRKSTTTNRVNVVEGVEEEDEVSTDDEEEMGEMSVANPDSVKTCSC